MTRDEAKKIIMAISGLYPNFKPADLKLTVDTWAVVLSEYGYKQIESALIAYSATDRSGFAPAPGQLIGLLDMQNQESDLNEMEAWALVSNALRNGYYGAEQEFAKLPETVQKAVGDPGNLRHWAQTDSNSVENVIQSNFMRSYRAVLKREQDMRKMPEKVKGVLIGADERVGIEKKDKPLEIPFNNFKQRDYDFEELEKQFVNR